MAPGVVVLIEHEKEVITTAKKVLELVKGLKGSNSEARKDIDNCSDELCRIIASCETFVKIVKSSAENY